MGIYMKYGEIQGDATQKDYEGWINLDHFEWSLERKFALDQVGRAFNREAAQAQMHHCLVKKAADASSGKLLQTATTEFKGQTCHIAFVRTGNPGDWYLKFKLTDALIANLDVGTQGNERPIESITINFTEIEIHTKTLNETNNGEDPLTITYDSATGIGG
ncbi:MAG TPA: type VI secretion system tube protein Hcp [Stellaceae bacterium]|jgi:type VI secretion system secreted protein Hcp